MNFKADYLSENEAGIIKLDKGRLFGVFLGSFSNGLKLILRLPVTMTVSNAHARCLVCGKYSFSETQTISISYEAMTVNTLNSCGDTPLY